MSLAIDSLVTDLIFAEGELENPEELINILGGKEELAKKQVVDPDMQDPRFEMELSPSRPFRRRNERRLMIIDGSVAPMRQDPRAESVVPIDLRDARDRLIEICEKLPIRVGRLFALGSWGDAVWVAKSFRDIRGLCLLTWLLDPTVDLRGRRRANQLSQAEFEEKILGYDKRLEELDEEQIKSGLDPALYTERDGLVIVDLLEKDGTWDTEKSLEAEIALAAVDRFSTIVGARSAVGANAQGKTEDSAPAPSAQPSSTAEVAEEAAPIHAPLVPHSREDGLVVEFPMERFDLEVAAALGKGDWTEVLRAGDPIEGSLKDQIFRHGAHFVAPIEFLSEAFLDGKPINKAQFEELSSKNAAGSRSLQVHFPRFGPATLVQRADGRRFISSLLENAASVVDSLS